MKRFQLLTTAIFLFCTLLIAGCTGRGVEAQATAAPEATPTATADIMSGIQTGDSAVNKILAGTWTFERTDADKKTDEGSASQILPSTDTGAKETTDVKEPGTIRELTFRTNGTGTYTDANGTPLAFEFALNGDNLTLGSFHHARLDDTCGLTAPCLLDVAIIGVDDSGLVHARREVHGSLED